MNTQAIVQQALQCLKELDRHPLLSLAPAEISRRQQLPLNQCLRVLHRLSLAGITRWEVSGEVSLVQGLAELTPDQVLDAVWMSFETKPPVQMLVGDANGQVVTEAVVQMEDILLG